MAIRSPGLGRHPPWPAVVAALRRESHGRPTIIARDASDSDVVQLLLRDSSRHAFVDGSTAAARRAEFVLKDELPFPDPQADRLIRDGGFRLVARLPRPRGGAVVLLFERTCSSAIRGRRRKAPGAPAARGRQREPAGQPEQDDGDDADPVRVDDVDAEAEVVAALVVRLGDDVLDRDRDRDQERGRRRRAGADRSRARTRSQAPAR